MQEIAEDAVQADAAHLVFDSDARVTSGAGQAQIITDPNGDQTNGQ